MTVDEIKKTLLQPEYDFLRKDPHLGINTVMIGIGGSYAYGTEKPDGTSDLDIRGIATRSPFEVLTNQDFGQILDIKTDTTIYSFDKIVKLFCECNPNTIEILGLLPQHYLYLSSVGHLLIDNRQMFLSKRAVHSFGGYAQAQLRRLENKAMRVANQEQRERHILQSIQHAEVDYKAKYFPMKGSIKTYVDKSDKEGFDSEIFLDFNLSHYPLRDMCSMVNEMNAIVSAYNKIGRRNSRAIEHGKLGKHMMHLVRLYFMCFDILENGEINTYRSKEHDLLMDIRGGKYLNNDSQPIPAFYEMVDELEEKLKYDSEHTELPEKVDMIKVNRLVESVNFDVVMRKKDVGNRQG